MSSYIWAMPWLPNTQDLKLLMLGWRSFASWGNIYVVHCASWTGRHFFVYESLPQNDTLISEDPRPGIDDAPLTLICRMGQGACRFCFCLLRRPIPHLWMVACNRHLDYQDATPEIVDALLRFLFGMRQGFGHNFFCLSRQPIPHFWMGAPNRHVGYPRWKAKNCWHSVDSHFQNGALTMSRCLLPLNTANMLVIHNSDQITFQLPYLQDQ